MSVATSSILVASPHMSRCRPTVQTSPFCTKDACSSAEERSKSSSFASSLPVPKKSASSLSSKPVSIRSKSAPCSASISTRSMSSSHPASSAMRLSARMYAFFCASVRWSANTQGNSVMPSARAAAILPCPAITPKLRSMMTGLMNPNSRRDARSLLICSGLFVRALF